MNDLTRDDEIDRLIDDLARDPAGAETLKRTLRARLAPVGVVRPSRKTPAAAEIEDFWDNVPV